MEFNSNRDRRAGMQQHPQTDGVPGVGEQRQGVLTGPRAGRALADRERREAVSVPEQITGRCKAYSCDQPTARETANRGPKRRLQRDGAFIAG